MYLCFHGLVVNQPFRAKLALSQDSGFCRSHVYQRPPEYKSMRPHMDGDHVKEPGRMGGWPPTSGPNLVPSLPRAKRRRDVGSSEWGTCSHSPGPRASASASESTSHPRGPRPSPPAPQGPPLCLAGLKLDAKEFKTHEGPHGVLVS